jgi:LAO/AO transport system kinase
MQNRLSVENYIAGILSGSRPMLGRAITLIESQLESDKEMAQQVLDKILPYTGRSVRVGITGVPGVGKSTFIETFGKYMTDQQKKLAVLAIDPTSQRSKGSIMGDKTRMEELSHNPLAFIRPSPAGSSLGGVTHRTRETILLCEAAGYEVIFVETVGVGQSETLVKGMVDFFLLLMLAGAGDELQGIKKGIMEMADAIVITKADGDNVATAQRAVVEYQNALHLFPANTNSWYPTVCTCSALYNQGFDSIWAMINQYVMQTKDNGFFAQNRQAQQLEWLHSYIKQTLESRFYENNKQQIEMMEKAVLSNQILPIQAALSLLK